MCDREFAVATDARRKEIYWARYNAHGKRIGNIKVVAPQSLAEEERWLPTAGQASNLYVDLFPFVLEPTLPCVAVMAVKAESLALSDSSPLYLRHPDATPPGVVR
jgi:tRNA A37 threonylcarbamoyladenosine modification protein TsaB